MPVVTPVGVPDVITGKAKKIIRTKAVAGGTVNPNGALTSYWIEYGLTTEYDKKSVVKTGLSGASQILVEVVLSELEFETTYHYRLVAENSAGKTVGKDLQFTTEKFVVPPHKIIVRKVGVEWKLYLVNSATMESLGEIKQARDKSFQLALNKSGGCDFQVPLDYGLFSSVEEIKHGVIAYRNDVPRYSGPIWNLDEQTESNSLRVSSVGWFELLNHRILRLDVGYPSFGAGTITAGQIVFANPSGTPGTSNYFPGGLLTIANAQRDTWITEGISSDQMNRIITYQKGQSIGGAISQLSEIEAGFDFDIDPLTRIMDIKNWNEVRDRTEAVVFGFNWGPGNIEKLGRQFDVSTMVNRYTALGKYGGGFAEDIPSQEEFQLFEEQTQLSDVVDPNVLLGYAGGEVLLRKTPRIIYSFQPFPFVPGGRVPAPFEDYDLGDLISFTAIKPPRIDIRGQVARVFGINVTVTNEGNEKITALQISPS